MKTQKEKQAEVKNEIEKNESSKFNFDKSKFGVKKEYKDEWIIMDKAFQEVTKLKGIPKGHVVSVYGKSDTGKTSFMLQVAKNAQQQGVLPVFIITENKFNIEHAIKNGIDIESAIFYDQINTIEEAAKNILFVLEEQKKGNLPYDLIFLWDSIGMTPSEQDFVTKPEEVFKQGMMSTARSVRTLLVRTLAPRINLSRLADSPYTNTLFLISHAYTTPPKGYGQATLEPYGGDGIFLVSSLVFKMGGVYSRASKIYMTKDKTKTAIGIITKIHVEKNHVTNVSAYGEIICVETGFLTEKDLDDYKKKLKNELNLSDDVTIEKEAQEEIE